MSMTSIIKWREDHLKVKEHEALAEEFKKWIETAPEAILRGYLGEVDSFNVKMGYDRLPTQSRAIVLKTVQALFHYYLALWRACQLYPELYKPSPGLKAQPKQTVEEYLYGVYVFIACGPDEMAEGVERWRMELEQK